MTKLKFLIGSSFCLIFLSILLLSANHSTKKNASHQDDLGVSSLNNEIDSKVEKSIEKRRNLLDEAISSYFKDAIRTGEIIGSSVSVVQGKSVVYAEGFGYKNASEKSKVDGETVFRLGSLSKGFTGVLAGILRHEGTLSFNDKVVECLPEFQLGNQENTSKITLSHILSHSSGTPYHSYTDLVEGGVNLVRIAGMFKNINPISEPGELYSYQNAMFALSSEMMERSSGTDFNESLKTKIFEPLNMVSTSTDYSILKSTDNIALPHSKRKNYWKPLNLTDKYFNAVAAGGISASAMDMAQWMKLLLGHKPEVASKDVLNEVFEPRIEINGSRKYYQKWDGHVSSHYGFGWRILQFEDEATKEMKKIIHHGGSVNNYRNEIAIFPNDDIGICVLINSYSKISKNVIPDLYKLISEVIEQPEYKLSDAELDTVVISTNNH